MKEIHLVNVDDGPRCYMQYDKKQHGYSKVLVPEEVPIEAAITTVNISIPAIEESLFKLEATEEGQILAQYIGYLQALLKSTVMSIFPYERS